LTRAFTAFTLGLVELRLRKTQGMKQDGREGELLGLSEIAELAGVSRQVVANWRSRDAGFPTPVVALASGPVYDRSQIRSYLTRRRRRGTRMAHVISTINLKGGVGKTTVTVGLAEMLAGEWGRSVLVIDLDPQTNATVALLGEKRWKRLNEKGHTLHTLFADALVDDTADRRFDLGSTLQEKASPTEQARGNLHLLPSSLDLIDVQDRLASMPSGRFYSNNPTDLLNRATRAIIDEYDYVLIDCPPNLGIITLNGLRLSEGFMIPTIPDVMSTYGIPQILRRVEAFADELGQEISPLGIVVSKYREQSTEHRQHVQQLRRRDDYPDVFETRIPESNELSAAASSEPRSTLRQRWGYSNGFPALDALCSEIVGLLEEDEA
jgi:chromosome partitioning protein